QWRLIRTASPGLSQPAGRARCTLGLTSIPTSSEASGWCRPSQARTFRGCWLALLTICFAPITSPWSTRTDFIRAAELYNQVFSADRKSVPIGGARLKKIRVFHPASFPIRRRAIVSESSTAKRHSRRPTIGTAGIRYRSTSRVCAPAAVTIEADHIAITIPAGVTNLARRRRATVATQNIKAIKKTAGSAFNKEGEE